MTKKDTLPKLIASDIGGTLVSSGNIIPAFTSTVLNRLVNDIPVALITGYNYNTTMTYTQGLDERILLLPQNGTLCIKEKKITWEYHIPPPEAGEIYRYLAENDFPTIVYKGKNEDFKNYYIHQTEIPSLNYAFQRIQRLENFENITGISTLLPDDLARIARPKIQAIAGIKFKVIYTRESKGSWLEVVHADVRKDLAMKRLCAELSVPPAEVIYFGDNFNDLEVLRSVGYPVLVDNAAPELKEEFETVVPSVTEQGVAKYLNNLYHLDIII
ncbi:MAG TPA: HAD family hydrolase [Candidatus Deferrimicrobium sp.]|nr:HAD family hydrolase [Candidatus Deferrimicrobium sp.]